MRRVSISLILAVGFVVSPMLLARVKELNVVLRWNPNGKQAMPALDTTGGIYPLVIPGVIDKRDKGKQIGENTEDKVAVPVYTSSDVPGYVRDHLTAQLKAIGLDVRAADSGDRVLQFELVEFWVAEGKRYRGSVRMKVSITDSSGKELWSALVGGMSDNFGRSLKPDNYTESVSDAMQDLAAKLVSAPGFRPAIAKTP